MRRHRGKDDVDLAALENFLSTVEGVRKNLITDILDSVENVRHNVQKLTITEAFVAHQYERDTLNRRSILNRLEQRARGRASELIQVYFDSLEGE